ncbi:uncharacterized protein TNIN_258941 [Trichonephila inaurata madagascariensis]|uniref:Uncharacterized protein n=1 Tax=Trichonephila inaurata madagascariensis TaxID=2747483 RepID=A0A8X6YHL2_9ARAC|nr:uncharacterized protein TNIN_258941 [Trichonephila inaurata madagascariensis]
MAHTCNFCRVLDRVIELAQIRAFWRCIKRRSEFHSLQWLLSRVENYTVKLKYYGKVSTVTEKLERQKRCKKKRSLPPHHGFIIVNRKNTTNFIESITSDMQFQLQEPYLLYKNHSGDIIGSWFYEQKDLRRIMKKIQTIILKQTGANSRQRCVSDSETKDRADSPNIMALLEKAQDKYMKALFDSHKVDNDIGFNSLYAHSDKKSLEKSVEFIEKQQKSSVVRSTSEENCQISPRRRFMSTGSLDADRISTFPAAPFLKNQSTKVIEEEKKTKDFNGSHLSAGDRVAPTRLSPLFSQNEISSPILDVTSIKKTFQPQFTNPIPDHYRTNSLPGTFSGVLDRKTNLGPNCDIHFTNMKEVLKSHIQNNPHVMLKIHEAYFSILRSVFTKN